MNEKEVQCKNCGALFDPSKEACPFCGALFYPGAEKEYLKAIEGIKDEMAETSDDSQEGFVDETKKVFKTVLLTMVVTGIILALLYLAFGKNSAVKCNRNKVTFLNVLCICNYLYRSICTDVHLTNEESICVFVRSF